MKKIMLTATALVFTVAMFAQKTGSAPVTAKPAPKAAMAQNQTKPSEEKKEAKDEKKNDHPKKEHAKKAHHHTDGGKEHPKK